MPRNFDLPSKTDMRCEGPEPECPKCGAPCDHTDGEKQIFAYAALQEAAEWYDRLCHVNFVYQYLPAFVDGDPIQVPFSTEEELLGMGWIDRWSKLTGFKRFILMKIHPDVTWHKSEYALGAEYDEAAKLHLRRQGPHLIAFLQNKNGVENIEVVHHWQEQGPAY